MSLARCPFGPIAVAKGGKYDQEGERRVLKTTERDPRFSQPLYTVAEASRFLGVPSSTLGTWAKGYVRHPAGRPIVHGAPIITSIEAIPGSPTIPFGGLAEAMVLAAFRESGISLQHIRAAVDVLSREMGIEHALASRRLYADGAKVLFDYADERGDDELVGLTEVVSRQRVFAPVIQDYLRRIEYADDPWAVRITSPATARPVVVADPQRAFGQPIFARGAAPVESIESRIRAGDRADEVAADFGVPLDDVAECLHILLPLAA